MARFGRIVGLDFSGARDAGRRIWVTIAEAEADHLRVKTCQPAMALPGAAADRDKVLAALRAFLAEQNAAVGIDAPFTLPACMMGTGSYRDFLRQFASRFSAAEDFRADCQARVGGKEIKRRCDRAAQTPFSPYNLRLYRQTFSVLRDVLAPLVLMHGARVVPISDVASARMVLLETCPASWLKRCALYAPYKGNSDDRYAQREAILAALSGDERLMFDKAADCERILADAGGDALDSVIAAAIVARAGRGHGPPADWDGPTIEGWVYH